MDKFLSIIEWLTSNYDDLAVVLIGSGVLVESFRKAIPTKSEKSALEIIGGFITKLLSKVPSNIKKDK